jgi:NitT/TauT family transport system ATP-binding protein
MSAPLVTFRSATKRFGHGPVVLDRLDLAIHPGDFVSLIGPSGCGKSTLLRVLAGLTPLESGEVRLAPHAGEASFVFQDATLLPWLTVGANVEVPLQLRGRDAAARAAVRDRMLARVRLADKCHAYPRQLSGGQKMRVSLARALTLSPSILLLDEPFGALDEMTREHLNEELLALRQQESWTALFVTHSVMEAVFLSNRIIVMAANPGRVHAEIPVSLPYPRTPETRVTPEFQNLVAQVSRVLRSVEGAVEP